MSCRLLWTSQLVRGLPTNADADSKQYLNGHKDYKLNVTLGSS